MGSSVRYQVFISSTYVDLVSERRAVIEALIRFGYIPSGMEWFPSSDTDQFEYIKLQIDQSDFVIVILKGRYGVGYTEKEYDYALSIGKPVLVFLYDPFESIPQDCLDENDDMRLKFRQFREKTKKNKLISFWKGNDLPLLVIQSLNTCSEDHPELGWVRKNEMLDGATTNQLIRENLELKAKLEEVSKSLEAPSLLTVDDDINLDFKIDGKSFTLSFTCCEFLKLYSNLLVKGLYDEELESTIKQWAESKMGHYLSKTDLVELKNTITFQLEALDVLSHYIIDDDIFWEISGSGYDNLVKVMALKK